MPYIPSASEIDQASAPNSSLPSSSAGNGPYIPSASEIAQVFASSNPSSPSPSPSAPAAPNLSAAPPSGLSVSSLASHAVGQTQTGTEQPQGLFDSIKNTLSAVGNQTAFGRDVKALAGGAAAFGQNVTADAKAIGNWGKNTLEDAGMASAEENPLVQMQGIPGFDPRAPHGTAALRDVNPLPALTAPGKLLNNAAIAAGSQAGGQHGAVAAFIRGIPAGVIRQTEQHPLIQALNVISLAGLGHVSVTDAGAALADRADTLDAAAARAGGTRGAALSAVAGRVRTAGQVMSHLAQSVKAGVMPAPSPDALRGFVADAADHIAGVTTEFANRLRSGAPRDAVAAEATPVARQVEEQTIEKQTPVPPAAQEAANGGPVSSSSGGAVPEPAGSVQLPVAGENNLVGAVQQPGGQGPVGTDLSEPGQVGREGASFQSGPDRAVPPAGAAGAEDAGITPGTGRGQQQAQPGERDAGGPDTRNLGTPLPAAADSAAASYEVAADNHSVTPAPADNPSADPALAAVDSAVKSSPVAADLSGPDLAALRLNLASVADDPAVGPLARQVLSSVDEAKGTQAAPGSAPTAGAAAGQSDPPLSLENELEQNEGSSASSHAANLNLDRMDTPDDLKAALVQTAQELSDQIQQQRRGTITHEQTRAAARDLGLQVDHLGNVKSGQALNAEQAYAVRELLLHQRGEVTTAEAAYRANPTDENLLALRKATKGYQATYLTATGSAAEAGRALAQFKMLSSAFRSQKVAEDLFKPTGEAVNPKARTYGQNNKFFTAEKAAAARERLREASSRLNSGLDPGLLADAVELGGYHLEAGLRAFPAWAAKMREDLGAKVSDGTLQHIWANVRAEAAERQKAAGTPRTPSAVFVDQLAARLGREGAAGFVNSIGKNGGTALLDKLLSGDTLTEAERKTISAAYLDNYPERPHGSVAQGALKAVQDAVKAARADRDAAARAQAKGSMGKAGRPAPTPEKALMSRLTQQLGKDGAEAFRRRLAAPDGTEPTFSRLANGAAMTAAERDAIGKAFLSARRPRSAPRTLTNVETQLRQIVAEAHTQAARETGLSQPLRDRLRDYLLKNVQGTDAPALAKDLAAVKDGDFAGFNRVMKKYSKLSPAQSLVGLYRAGLLSSPVTLGRIAASQGAFSVAEELKRVPAVLADAAYSKATGTPRTTAGANLPASLRALKTMLTQGTPEALELLRHGEMGLQERGVDSVARRAELPTEYSAGLGHEAVNKAANAYVNTVFRSHGSVYHLTRSYAYARAIDEQATLAAKAEAKAGLIGAGDVAARAKALRDQPTESMKDAATHEAEVATFVNENRIADALQAAKGKLSPNGRAVADVILPFSRVPSNIASQVLESTIGLPKSVYQLAAARAAKHTFTPEEQRAFANSFGRGTVGAASMAIGYYAASKGLLGGSDARTHDKGDIKPGTLTVAGRAVKTPGVEIGRLDPSAAAFIQGANLYAAMHGTKTQKASAPGGAFDTEFGENPLVGGAEALMQAAEPGGVKRTVNNAAGTVVPQGIAALAQMLDHGTPRRVDTPLDAIKARVPGLREKLPVKKSGKLSPGMRAFMEMARPKM